MGKLLLFSDKRRKKSDCVTLPPEAFFIRYCGVCLMDRAEIVKLGVNGICPHCGADYGKDQDIN